MTARPIRIPSQHCFALRGAGGDDAKPEAAQGHCIGSSWGGLPGDAMSFIIPVAESFVDAMLVVRFGRGNQRPVLRLQLRLDGRELAAEDGTTEHRPGATGGWGEQPWHWRELVVPLGGALPVGTHTLDIVSGGVDCWITLDAIAICERDDVLRLVNEPRATLEAELPPIQGSFDAATGIFHDAHQTNGVPLGGIGAGKVEVLPSLWFANWVPGANVDAPWRASRPTLLALRCLRGGDAVTRVLRGHTSWEYANVENIAHIDFLGLFPRVEAELTDPGLPVAVRVEAFSPLLPGDADASSTPGLRLNVRLANPGCEAVDIEILLGCENLAGRIAWVDTVDAKRQHRHEPDTAGGWVEPMVEPGFVGVRLGQDHSGTGQQANAVGELGVAVARAPGQRAEACCFDAAGHEPAIFANGGLQPRMLEQRSRGDAAGAATAGSVRVSLRLSAGAIETISFALAWRFPHQRTRKDGRDIGRRAAVVHPDVASAIRLLLHQGERLEAGTRAWQELLRQSDLPSWLPFKIINGAFPAYTNSLHDATGRFTVIESPMTMAGALGTMDQRLAAHPFWSQLYPDLDHAELDLFRACQRPDGRITHFTGNLHETVGDPEVGYGVTDWPDLSCSWIMQEVQRWRWIGDRAAAETRWKDIRRALAWLVAADRDRDGVPEGGNTYDYEKAPEGLFIYNASCWLGALRCAEAMAIDLGDTTTAADCRRRFVRARRNTIRHLWNGRWFRKWRVHQTGIRSENSFIASFAGDWMARQAGVGGTMPPEITATCLRELHRRHVHAFPLVPPMEVTPDGAAAVESSYVHQHEPYLGLVSIMTGRVDEGLEVLHRNFRAAWVDNRVGWNMPLNFHVGSGRPYMLWNYMTNTATWAAPHALAGATLDLPAGAIYCDPRPPAGRHTLSLPLFFPGLWLWLDWEGELRLARLRVLRCDRPGMRLTRWRRITAAGRLQEHPLREPVTLAPDASFTLAIPPDPSLAEMQQELVRT